MRLGCGVDIPACVTCRRAEVAASPSAAPSITSVEAVCLGSDMEEAQVTSDAPCLFRFRAGVGTKATSIAYGDWTAWTAIPVVSASYRFEIPYSLMTPYFGVEVEAKLPDGTLSDDNPAGDIFQWGMGGACP